MSERLPPQVDSHDALDALMDILARQAAALNLLFYRAAVDGLSHHGPGSRRNMRMALNAQALCRQAFKFSLPCAPCLAKNFQIRTNRLLQTQNLPHDQQLAAWPPSHLPARGRGARKFSNSNEQTIADGKSLARPIPCRSRKLTSHAPPQITSPSWGEPAPT